MKSTSEIASLLKAPTAKEKLINEQFRTKGGVDVKRMCPFATRTVCKHMNHGGRCDLVHFKRYVQSHTNEALGDCKLLNLCPNMETCNLVHYIPDDVVSSLRERRE